MDNDDTLIGQVATRAAGEARPLAPTAGPEDVAGAERQLGFALPTLLGRLYTEVANGGFGPEYYLFPLTGEGRTAVSAYREEYGTDRDGADGADGASPHWPRGVLPIMDWGCGMYAAVDCLHPDAPVLLFEPNAGPDDWADAWFQDTPSLTAWLRVWLAGTGWWEEEALHEDDAVEPQPWADAARRLGHHS
ncbi:SMI1/KNR4 family protein [Kitasatospora sp. NBC_01560]|uniref:SMI1/KNR4 family protein n=1 Tax=Kitasatospora sp. NBC_01560 TaxID=2975965 RepID=UPI00386A7C90